MATPTSIIWRSGQVRSPSSTPRPIADGSASSGSGGLFSQRRTVLLIGGRDHTGLIEGVESQIAHVRSALRVIDQEPIDIRGALCFPGVDGLPLLGQLSLRGIIVDGPGAVAKLARRPGAHSPEAIELL